MEENSEDPFDLQRFVQAQDGIYGSALSELRDGRKKSHWMWFIFPQIRGLGSSETSRRYAITGLDEARTYLKHPLLGPRLLECAQAVLDVEGRSALEIFGKPDDAKLRSSMTLFEAAGDDPAFPKVLDKYFSGVRDPETLRILDSQARPSSR